MKISMRTRSKLRERGFAGPIVAVTASALKGERENCLEAGMNDILVKPFKREDLESLLADYLPTLGEGQAPRASLDAQLAPIARGKLDSSVFDWAGVLDTFLGQTETVISLLRRFVSKAGAQLEELQAALGSGDAKRFMEISHSLKGAAWNLSARRLGDSALAGETAGRESDMEAAALSLLGMKAAYADFAEAVAPYTGA